MNMQVKDIAEIKLISFMELEVYDVLLLKGLFADLTNGIRSEREYFHRAKQNASILDVHFEKDDHFNDEAIMGRTINWGMHTETTEESPNLTVNLTFIDQDKPSPYIKKISIPNHVEEMGEEEVGNYSFQLPPPVSVNVLDEMNNMGWLRQKCWVLRDKPQVQGDKKDIASGAVPFLITTEIKKHAQKCDSIKECISYIQDIEIDLNHVEMLQSKSSNEFNKTFRRSNLGSTFPSGYKKWDEALNLVKRPDTALDELGDALIAGSPFAHNGKYLKKLNKALGVLFLSKEDFANYAHSGGVAVQYSIDQNFFEADQAPLVMNQNWFKLMLMDRGILALDALNEVIDFFRAVRIGPASSAIARIFAHLLLGRLPDKNILFTRHDMIMRKLLYAEFYDKNKATIKRGRAVAEAAKKGGDSKAVKTKAETDKKANMALDKIHTILCNNKSISFTEAKRKAAREIGIGYSTLSKAGVTKDNYRTWLESRL